MALARELRGNTDSIIMAALWFTVARRKGYQARYRLRYAGYVIERDVMAKMVIMSVEHLPAYGHWLRKCAAMSGIL